MFSCRAILFDLDGTLIDSIATVDRAWTKWALRHNLNPDEVVPQIHGRRAIDSLRRFVPNSDIDIEEEFRWLEQMEAADTEGVVEIDGSLSFLAGLPSHQWAIVTSGTSPVATARMGAVGIIPVVAVYGEDVENGKPHPDPYLEAARRMQLDPSECIVFEDTRAGILSGQAAGMKVIAVNGGVEKPELDLADALIANYRQITSAQNPDGLRVDITFLK